MILAIGNSGAYEQSAFLAVRDALADIGREVVFFRQDACLENDFLSFEQERGASRTILTIEGRDYDAASFEAIWCLKPILPERILRHPNVDHREFIQKQFLAMRDGLRRIFRHKRWLNDPANQQMVENKPYQLEVAAQAGFRLPATLVTSDPDRARRFIARHRNTVVKTLATHPLHEGMVFTNALNDERIAQLNSLKFAPCIFQELVPKAHELRVTVVGERMFAAKIHSQTDSATTLDYRKKPDGSSPIAVEATDLSESLSCKIRSLMGRLGLRYGCLDVIVTPDGDEVFLEINPNGQWWFIQRETGLPIARAIAEALVR